VGSESISVAALFSGVHVLVHGIVTAGRVLAVSMVVRLRRRTMEGRVLSVHGAVLMLRNRGANVRVDMPRNLMVADGRRALPVSSLRVGAIIQVDGWELDTAHLRAVHLAVKHPLVTATARVVEAGSTLVVQTARGDRYELVVPASLTIETSRGNLPLTATDIPMGARVHVEGRIGRRGKLRVLALSVRLTASTLRGAVNPTSLTSWTVQTATGVTSVRLGAQTIVEQGRHILTPSDVVHGDDATVYGYSLRTGIIARKIDVHRRLTGLDGTVTAVTPSGFTVSAVDGAHHVLTGSPTVYIGSLTAVSVGMDVHVTGYLRGDGSVLATRVRLLKGGRGE